MASKVQLTGGQFQDLQGNQLALGYIKMKLSSDEEVNDSLICSGIEIQINLDSTGNCVVGQFVWGNDVMSPVNSFYKVTVYSASGQIVWGPNNQQVVGVGPFDVGTWIPNSVISWSPSVQSLALQVAGTPFSSQTVLDFVNSGNVIFTDLGNGTISANAPSGTVSGLNVADVPWNVWNRGSTSTLATAGFTYAQVQFANSIQFFANTWTVSIQVTTALSAAIQEMCVIRTLKDSLTTVDVTPIKFGGSATPIFSTIGTKTSDAVSLVIDALHDYYFCFTPNVFGGSGNIASNSGSSSAPLYTSFAGNCNSATPRSSAWASSVGAGGGFFAAFPVGNGFTAYFLTGWNLVS